MRSLFTLGAAASLTCLSFGQVRLTEIGTIDLSSTSDPMNPEFIGSNPSAIAWDGTDLYAAGLNSSGATAPVGIARVTDPLGAASFGPAFGLQSAPNSRGYSGLDISGAGIAAAYDSGASDPQGIALYDPAGVQVWVKDGRGGSGVAFNPGFPGGDPALGEGVAWATFGSGRARLQDAATGADIWDGTNGFVIFTSEGSFFRDLDFEDATGDVWVREGNNVLSFTRNGDNSVTNAAIVFDQDPDADFVSGQNIAHLQNEGLVIYNDRSTTGGGQDFFSVVNVIDETGAPQMVNWGGFAPAAGSGYYDFSYDAATSTLAILDFGARSATIFQVATGPEPKPISLVNLRLNEAASSQTIDFLANLSVLGTEARNLYGIDFDPSGTTLYGVDDATLEIVTIDPATGVSTPTGTLLTGPASLTGLSGLSCAPDGTWYLSDYDGMDSNLFRGSIHTGVFDFVGVIAPANLMIDIACDAQGNLYGFSVSDDSLYTIDTSTGLGTPIGTGIGLNANFAQGMDFDWSTDTLFATVYTGSGTGAFCAIDLTTGVATILDDTTPTNSEFEMAVQAEIPGGISTNYCAAEPNSTGGAASIVATGSAGLIANDLVLTCTGMPADSFSIFIASTTQDFVPMAGGGAGNLCLGGSIGRGVGGAIYNSGAAGSISASVDWTSIPQPAGAVAAMAGDTWNFQCWFRDADVGGVPTFNYSDATSVLVR
ncbi:hypothetical protein Poly30_22660 [Planctomycetes bacterium Poly30]|uniref:SMP-30/Gluconolaconase/LRE-like region n=1 Tax=Saltatorellus ferox TaxID=2528018 RepID=A0A518ERM9_9BACT|nr:hypothetical protein Poly30_22660 [Planctomycetes bacterium Poly30]